MSQSITPLNQPITFSEWGAAFNGFIATCVETAGQILGASVTGTRVTSQGVLNDAGALFRSGQADQRGATTFGAEGPLLAGEGVPTYQVNASGLSPTDLRSVVGSILSSGRLVGIGFSNARALTTSTGAHPDAGVFGHAAVIEGADASGAFVADPNTPPGAGLVHYDWGSLVAAQPGNLLVTQAPVSTIYGLNSGNPQQPTSLSNPYLSPQRRGGTPENPGSGGITQGLISNPLDGISQAINNVSNTAADIANRAQIGAAGLVLLGVGLLILFWEPAKAGAGAAMDAAGAVNKQVFALNAARSARRGAVAQERTAKATEAGAKATRQAAQQQARANRQRDLTPAIVRSTLREQARRAGLASGQARRERRESAAVEADQGFPPEIRAQRDKAFEGIDATMRDLRGEQ